VYQAFPNPTVPEPAPKSVLRAVLLMCAGAVAYLISGIAGAVSFMSAPQRILGGGRPPPGAAVPAGVVTAVSAVQVTVILLSIVVPVVLWLWMAWKCRAGRPWARTLSTVLFGLATLFTLGSLAGSTGTWGLLGMIVSWLIGLGAVILLWQRPSSSFFRATPR
jgi:hypothetical protein